MLPAIHRLLAILLGMLAAFLVIVLVQSASGMLYPAPAGVNLEDPVALRAFTETLPVGAFLMVLLSYALAAFVGGLLAGWRAPTAWPMPPAGIALLLALASVMNLRAIPHPGWFWAANLVAVIVLPFAGAALTRVRPESPA
jgi:hypothetical protein